MDYLTLIFIAIGLSMDAFAVSVSHGIVIRHCRFKHAFSLALAFGLFQAIMPSIGWFLGNGFRKYVESVDHWIAFVLLLIIGLKMIYEAIFGDENNENKCNLSFFTIFVLAVATSIDAFAVGITFSMINISIFFPVIVIGLITFVNSLIGFYAGDVVGKIFGRKVEIAGGLILIFIGCKILFEHLVR